MAALSLKVNLVKQKTTKTLQVGILNSFVMYICAFVLGLQNISVG